jgi:hypothetical protein
MEFEAQHGEAVERCLACEAVVSRAYPLDGPYLCRRSVSHELTVDGYRISKHDICISVDRAQDAKKR